MATTKASVRMYRLHELGDCFLLKFTTGRTSSSMLIDCGSFRNSEVSKKKLNAIAKAIKASLAGKPLNVVVGTHQHNDHLSGFVHAVDEFKKMKPANVWLSWLDDPTDRMATAIGRDHNNLRMQLIGIQKELHASGRVNGQRSLNVLDEVLGFYGVKQAGGPPQFPAVGIAVLKELAPTGPQYLKPGMSMDMPGLPVGHVRVHVLGPPRDKTLLHRTNPRKGESYDHALAKANLTAGKLLDAAKRLNGRIGREEEHYPFAEIHKQHPGQPGSSNALNDMKRSYDNADAAWRNIDSDWLEQVEGLALFLDSYTNNSSLVLAIELVDSGKVLLFVGDAQTGNWLSWKDVQWEDANVSTDDLLRRTALYKVGHHGSHNATLKNALEKMESPHLVALIPVHKDDPNINKTNGWKMPAAQLYKRLIERTDGRVLRMDDERTADTDIAKAVVKAKWRAAKAIPNVTKEVVEVKL